MARRRSALAFSHKRFVRFFLVLALMAFVPPLFFHLKLRRSLQVQARKCHWMKSPPFVCAHGGDSSMAPPNTMMAYKLAIHSQVDCIEIDASRSSDGVLVALHDRDLQNISGYRIAKVGDVSINEIKRLDASLGYPEAFRNQKIPLLIDAVKYVASSVNQIIIDVKVGPPWFLEGLATELISVINKSDCKNCVVWAKVDSLPRELKKLSPNTTVGYIVMKDPLTGIPSRLLRLKEADIIGIYHILVDRKVVDSAHRAGKKVFAWTVDDHNSMQNMLYEGVDGIITSQPRLLRKIMEDLKKHCIENGF